MRSTRGAEPEFLTPAVKRLLVIAAGLVVMLLILAYRRWSHGPIADADYVVRVTPVYPRVAMQARIQGQVVVDVTIGSDGRLLASWIDASSGSTILDDAALQAARSSTYRPPMLAGMPMQRSFTALYDFKPPH